MGREKRLATQTTRLTGAPHHRTRRGKQQQPRLHRHKDVGTCHRHAASSETMTTAQRRRGKRHPSAKGSDAAAHALHAGQRIAQPQVNDLHAQRRLCAQGAKTRQQRQPLASETRLLSPPANRTHHHHQRPRRPTFANICPKKYFKNTARQALLGHRLRRMSKAHRASSGSSADQSPPRAASPPAHKAQRRGNRGNRTTGEKQPRTPNQTEQHTDDHP